jgi:hypothetical protein
MEEKIVDFAISMASQSPYGAAFAMVMAVSGSLYHAAQIIAPLTPTDLDDRAVAFLGKVPFLGTALRAAKKHSKFPPK